jgi:hypothetical protein
MLNKPGQAESLPPAAVPPITPEMAAAGANVLSREIGYPDDRPVDDFENIAAMVFTEMARVAVAAAPSEPSCSPPPAS